MRKNTDKERKNLLTKRKSYKKNLLTKREKTTN